MKGFVKMLIYMLVNLITEKAYIGQTQKSLAERWKDHWRSANEGSEASLHVAMREWDNDDLWDRVVLQVCYSVEQLNQAEDVWIEACCTRDGSVGYNARKGGHVYERLNSSEAGKLAFNNPNAGKPKEQMSEERREFFRQCGRRGTKPKNELSEEERQKFREWGKKGAASKKKLA